MGNFGSKAKIIIIIIVFIIIVGLLIAGLVYLIFTSKGSSIQTNLYTENQLYVTKYPITTPIVW